MKSTDWDAVAASVAQDKTASIVRDGSGDQWHEGFENCYKLQPGLKRYKGAQDKDLTGKTFGRFKVVGASDRGRKSKKGYRWVCKCSCSNFSVISYRALTKGLSERCNECEYFDWIKRGRPGAKNPDAKPEELIAHRQSKLKSSQEAA